MSFPGKESGKREEGEGLPCQGNRKIRLKSWRSESVQPCKSQEEWPQSPSLFGSTVAKMEFRF